VSWQVLTGVVEWWADEGLRDIGRLQRAGARSAPEHRTPSGTIDSTRAAFVAQRDPWRLSEITLGPHDDPATPAVTSWADNATAVLTGIPARQHVVGPNETWGDLTVRRMLDPAALQSLVAKPWASRFEIPGELLERDITVVPELVTLASDRYEVTYNRELGILVTWTANINGAVAQRTSLTRLTTVA
jgi:hypothetical protein